MSSQHVFSLALLDSHLETPVQLLQPNGMVAGERFDVYRNNVITSLVDAMAVGFPAVFRLLGEQYFRALAAAYARSHPPDSPVLFHYGDHFPAFIKGFEPLKDCPYLPDVAELELARRSSGCALDQKPLAAAQLALLGPETLMYIVPRAHASLRLLVSEWPILEIWSAQTGVAPRERPDMNLGSQSVLIIRPEMQVKSYALEADQYCFLNAMNGERSLSILAETVLEQFPQSDFLQLMVLMVRRGAIVDFIVPEEATL